MEDSKPMPEALTWRQLICEIQSAWLSLRHGVSVLGNLASGKMGTALLGVSACALVAIALLIFTASFARGVVTVALMPYAALGVGVTAFIYSLLPQRPR